VADEQGQHVVEKAKPGGNVGGTRAIEVEREFNAGFGGDA